MGLDTSARKCLHMDWVVVVVVVVMLDPAVSSRFNVADGPSKTIAEVQPTAVPRNKRPAISSDKLR